MPKNLRLHSRLPPIVRDRLEGGALFAFAGLSEQWQHKATGQPLETYTIITTDPNELMAPLHNRMPVVLAPDDYARWLAVGDRGDCIDESCLIAQEVKQVALQASRSAC
jgi:putative SOS response-associated peptidase YedK